MDCCLEKTLTTSSSTDYDIAMLVHCLFKGSYACCDIASKAWYVFKEHRWKEDKSMGIRNKISEEIYQLYYDKLQSYIVELQNINDMETERHEFVQSQLLKLSKTCEKVKRTADKNNIFRETMEVFFVDKFMEKMDSNEKLLCFNNGVIDFNTNTFRQGSPIDYISKNTKNNYFSDIELYM